MRTPSGPTARHPMVGAVGQADHVLAIDQGTTSTRAILFDADARAVAVAQRELDAALSGARLGRARPGADLAGHARRRARSARAASTASRVAAIGITNQRETVVVWDRATGRADPPRDRLAGPAHGGRVRRVEGRGRGALVRDRTGLLLDPYFSATKIAWILDNVAGARERAERGELACGTIDCFLLWRLTGGAVHATDVTNASRTSLFDIHRAALGRRALPALPRARSPASRSPRQ